MRPLLLSRVLLPWFAAAAVASAATPVVDKSAYSFANPTPEAQLRELTTDRPDVTESPFTVDAGHVQLELDLANYTRTRLDGGHTTEWGVVPFNLRFGIRHDFELGIFVTPWVRVTDEPRGGPRTRISGAGDTTLRGKWNFFGNDGPALACGLIVDVKLPTAADGLGNDKVEGGFLVPFTVDLPAGWSLSAMTGLAAGYNGSSYRPIFTNTVSFGHDLAENLDGYAELTSMAGDGAHVSTLDFGVAWKLDKHRQVDCGFNLGVSRAAPDVTLFAGYSQRF